MARKTPLESPDDAPLERLVRAIVAGRHAEVESLLARTPALATAAATRGATRESPKPFFFPEIAHYLMEGDTALHMAAAAHDAHVVSGLLARGARVEARNRRGGAPLHYAVDGGPGGVRWDPKAQVATVASLLEAGADPDARDKGGVTPLHRAVRNRCAAAVRELLRGGADPRLETKSGSTAWRLAEWTTGRGGSGSETAKRELGEIREALEASRRGTTSG